MAIHHRSGKDMVGGGFTQHIFTGHMMFAVHFIKDWEYSEKPLKTFFMNS